MHPYGNDDGDCEVSRKRSVSGPKPSIEEERDAKTHCAKVDGRRGESPTDQELSTREIVVRKRRGQRGRRGRRGRRGLREREEAAKSALAEGKRKRRHKKRTEEEDGIAETVEVSEMGEGSERRASEAEEEGDAPHLKFAIIEPGFLTPSEASQLSFSMPFSRKKRKR